MRPVYLETSKYLEKYRYCYKLYNNMRHNTTWDNIYFTLQYTIKRFVQVTFVFLEGKLYFLLRIRIAVEY